MSPRKPPPTIGERIKKICPVCGQRSYSAAGIHPQCAVQQADAPRAKKLKETKALKNKKKAKSNKRSQTLWNKKNCPKCGAIMHVRKKVCDCGHVMVSKK